MASALSTTVGSVFGGPLVKVASIGYGVRRALRRGSAQPRASRKVVVSRTLPAARRGGRRRGRD